MQACGPGPMPAISTTLTPRSGPVPCPSVVAHAADHDRTAVTRRAGRLAPVGIPAQAGIPDGCWPMQRPGSGRFGQQVRDEPHLATRCIGLPRSSRGPRTRAPRRPARAARVRARARAALRQVDRLLLARHPPADLPRPRPHGGRRLGHRRDRRPDRPPGQEGVRRLGRRPTGPRRLARRADAVEPLPQRARRQAARGVVRRPRDAAARTSPSCAPTTRPGWRTTAGSRPATTPSRPDRPSSSTSSSSCAAGSGWRSSGSPGSPTTSTPTISRHSSTPARLHHEEALR